MKENAMPESAQTFEECIGRLEALVRRLEQGELNLEEALSCYKEGIGLVQLCQKHLERTAEEVKVLTEGLGEVPDA